MRLATVNVNGVRAALRKGMVGWLETVDADIVCLQEVRAPDEVVKDAFAGQWHVAHQASDIKGRSGVAILSRIELRDVRVGADVFGESGSRATHTGRWIEATVGTPTGDVRVVSTYVHSGDVGTPKMDDKFAFLDMATTRLGEIASQSEFAVTVGDINTAHDNRDIRNWRGNLKSAGFLPEERAYLDRWFGSGWVDVHRALAGDVDGPYTWWSMRGKAFDNDAGWRIDYQIATTALADRAIAARVDRQASWDARWTDHAPLVVDYELG